VKVRILPYKINVPFGSEKFLILQLPRNVQFISDEVSIS